MTTAISEAPLVTTDGPNGTDDDLDHLFCCDENVAMCGADISDDEIVEDGSLLFPCVVCKDMEYRPCPKCGAL